MNTLIAMMMVGTTWATIKVPCQPVKELFTGITSGEYTEVVRWTAKENMNFVLLTNQKTGTWSFVGYDATNACFMAAGENSGDKE
jgi:hypothetical protein